jgi:hypothetical protein
VIKFVSDLLQICGFLRALGLVALNTINQTNHRTIEEAQVIETCSVKMGEEDEEDQMMHIVTDMGTEDGLSMAIT